MEVHKSLLDYNIKNAIELRLPIIEKSATIYQTNITSHSLYSYSE